MRREGKTALVTGSIGELPEAPLAPEALARLWSLLDLPEPALEFVELKGADQVLPSSFHTDAAAQITMGAAALAACELGHLRGQERQPVLVERTHAALECLSWFKLNGQVPDIWEKFSGLYPTADGWVRVHANFAHHRDRALKLLGLDAAKAEKVDVERALARWRATDFEDAAADAGAVVAALRSFDVWDELPQARAVAVLPLVRLTRIGDGDPLPMPALAADALPLAGVNVLDFTRILAGPVGTRALAGYGAQVLLLNAPYLPNIPAIAETSRGKLSAHLDLRAQDARQQLRELVSRTHVVVQGYRPGALAALGLDVGELARARPGIVCVSLSAYGAHGPWAGRRGFDSLVQTATGFNQAEGEAAGGPAPRALPMQILDHASGLLMAFAAAAALHRQQRAGGSWHAEVSLAQTGQWLRGLGRVTRGFDLVRPDLTPYLQTEATGFGELVSVRHAARLARTPVRFARVAQPPGTDAAKWLVA